MRICKLIDTKNGYEWISLSFIIEDMENNFSCVSAGCPTEKKYSGLSLNNFKAIETIILLETLLDRGKANLDFDILQLYIYRKLTEIFMFKFGSIFLVGFFGKICEK